MGREQAAILAAKGILERGTRLPITIIAEDGLARDGMTPAGFLTVGRTPFVAAVKSNARSATVAQAISQLRNHSAHHARFKPLLIVPLMGEAGSVACEEAGVHWVDLNGNADVAAEDFYLHIRGKRAPELAEESMWSETGVNPFSRKASRVVHELLSAPHYPWKRRQIEALTGLDKGYVSKIMAALAESGYVEKHPAEPGATRVADPSILLDAWREKYKPDRPASWCLVAARDGREATKKLTDIFRSASIDYALTGLASAEKYVDFGSYRRVDVYVADPLPAHVADDLRSGSMDRGRNVAVYIDSENAFKHGAFFDDMHVVSPVLTYLDLARLSERSEEAASEMRTYLEYQWKESHIQDPDIPRQPSTR